MNKKKNPTPVRALSTVWTAAFILIPLLLIFYYGLTAQDGALYPLQYFRDCHARRTCKALGLSLLLSLISTIICLLMAYPLAMILADMKLQQHRLYCDDLYHPHVDEFPAAHHGLADPSGEKRASSI